MPRKDLHEKPFDEATLTKLDIFERYLEAWLPTFLYSKIPGTIQIWDFFAGQGYDVKGQKGSPARIIDVIKRFEADILKSGKKIRVVLNETDPDKFDLLKTTIGKEFDALANIKHLIQIEFFKVEFQNLYKSQTAELQKGNNLIFLDQNGVKEVTEKIFLELCNLKTTDFLFFISSSYFTRFADDFKKIHPKLDVEEIRRSKYKKLHLTVLNLYKNYLVDAKRQDVFLFPFSLLKPTTTGYNIYGLIFGAKHILAAHKFLVIAWDKNKLNGQANYDIENDAGASQMDLFTGSKCLTKIEKFQKELEAEILSGRINNNVKTFLYTESNGHIPKHAEELLQTLKHAGKIEYDGRTSISYDAYKDKKIVEFKTKGK